MDDRVEGKEQVGSSEFLVRPAESSDHAASATGETIRQTSKIPAVEISSTSAAPDSDTDVTEISARGLTTGQPDLTTFTSESADTPQNPTTSLSRQLQVDSEDSWESDSAVGDLSASSYSTSLASSIKHYKYENGRRYHAYQEGKYAMPNDETEQERLDLQHHIWCMMVGGALYRAPLNTFDQPAPKRILDLGTGTGIWAIQIADEFPNATVIGTDLSPIQPGWVPPNCKFYVDDFDNEWGYPDQEKFDFIHGRALCGHVSNWTDFYRQCYHNLRPGGWLEIQEYRAWIDSDDDSMDKTPWVRTWIESLDEASIKFGRRMNVAHEQRARIEVAGFVDVHEEIHKIPIGTWAKDPTLKDVGLYERVHMCESVEAHAMALYTRVLGYTQEQVRVVVAGVQQEFWDKKLHLYTTYRFIWARKPE